MPRLSKIELVAIAAICHEANRAYCKSIGDHSQVPWETAPEWQRASAISGVELHTDNPYSTPRESHENWRAEKERLGWVYGEVKDAEKKEHPCMVPFANLPIEQQAKDYIFHGIVNALVHQSPMFSHRL